MKRFGSVVRVGDQSAQTYYLPALVSLQILQVNRISAKFVKQTSPGVRCRYVADCEAVDEGMHNISGAVRVEPY